MTLIGRYLEHGWDRPARPEAALRWYERGARGGDYRGQFDYARLLLERTGDLARALPFFERCVETGVPAFCRNVGAGLRRAPDADLQRVARRALEKATQTGDPADVRAYATALAEGVGGPVDAEGARLWFARARAQEAVREAAPLQPGPPPTRRAPQPSWLGRMRRRIFMWRRATTGRRKQNGREY